MRIIADSGSTKTTWYLENGDLRKFVSTQGINPFQQSADTIANILHNELLGEIDSNTHVNEVFFYGAGCTPEKCPTVQGALRGAFPEARIFVGSDMLGAARAACGNTPGIVAILGTGANSCYYDGEKIAMNVSPLGFILGDEGSGAYIGKRLVGDCLKGQLTEQIREQFLAETHETPATIIQKVYREPMPNRFLASLSPFCARHREEPSIHALLVDCFEQFFIRNIYAYDNVAPTLRTVHFIGSIAYFYKQELEEAAERLGYKVGKVLREPILGLVECHA